MNKRFKQLLEAQLGNVKPLISEQTSGQTQNFDKTYFEKNPKGVMVISNYGIPTSINGITGDFDRQFLPFFQQNDGFGRGFNSGDGNFDYEFTTEKTMRNPEGEMVLKVKNPSASAQYTVK